MKKNHICRCHIPSKPIIDLTPEPFDGKEDFDYYIQYFESCALVGKWDEYEKC